MLRVCFVCIVAGCCGAVLADVPQSVKEMDSVRFSRDRDRSKMCDICAEDFTDQNPRGGYFVAVYPHHNPPADSGNGKDGDKKDCKACPDRYQVVCCQFCIDRIKRNRVHVMKKSYRRIPYEMVRNKMDMIHLNIKAFSSLIVEDGDGGKPLKDIRPRRSN